MTCDLPCPTPGYCADQDGGCANDNAMRDASRGLDSVVEWVPFPVVTDPAMPPDTFVIGSPAAPPRVFMAPAGSPPGVSHEWVEVGTLASAPEWDTVESAASDEPIRAFRTDETFTLTLDATLPPRPRPQYVASVAPLDVWDVLLGPDTPGARHARRDAALAALAVACHRAGRDLVVRRVLENAGRARMRAMIRAEVTRGYWTSQIMDPADFVRIAGV